MKKYLIIMLLLVLIGFNFVKAENNINLLGKIIYIDPGHGGIDPGAIYKTLKEETINLEISKKIENTLSKQGATVYLTRYDDYDLSSNYSTNKKRSDLSQRAKLINESKCDLYISIHLNSNLSDTWHGSQVYYNNNNNKNQKLAKILQKNLVKELDTNRKATYTTKLYLNNHINVPGVLFEVGFLSNPTERYLLKQETYQQKIANIVSKSIKEFFS